MAEDAPRRLTVVLVEDDELIRSNTAEHLVDQGHVVVEARDAESALTALSTCQADVLLMDVGLPGRSGAELAREAVSRWPHLKVIFASGDDAGRAESGLSDAVVLLQPYAPKDLAAALKVPIPWKKDD